MPPLPSDDRQLLEFLWGHYRTNGGWPTRRVVALWLDQRGTRFIDKPQLGRIAHLGYEYDPTSIVVPHFDALIELPVARAFFAPLALLARTAAQWFIEAPYFGDTRERCRVSATKLVELWGDRADGEKALELIRQFELRFISYDGSDGAQEYFCPQLESLKYEGANTLDGLLEIRRAFSAPRVDHFPSGQPFFFLKRVHEYTVGAGEWPLCIPFAVKNRDLGFIPDLHRQCTPRFVRGDFRSRRDDRISLLSRALPHVDPAGVVQQMVLRIAQAVRTGFVSGSERMTGADLAASLQAPIALVAVALRYLEHEAWASISLDDPDPGAWRIAPYEVVLENGRLSSFEDYLEYWHDGGRTQIAASLDRVAGDPGGSEEREDSPLDLGDVVAAIEKVRSRMTSVSLGAQIARDAQELQRTAGAGAWKSTMILAGSIAEAVLVDFLSLNQRRAAESCGRGEKWAERAGLQMLIKVANAEQLLQDDSAQLAEYIKEYRDLIHPRKAATTSLRPDRVAAKTITHLLERVVADLLAAAGDGRLTKYQNA